MRENITVRKYLHLKWQPEDDKITKTFYENISTVMTIITSLTKKSASPLPRRVSSGAKQCTLLGNYCQLCSQSD